MSQLNNAEQRFRAAFVRLKEGSPEVLPVGSEAVQNNVAIEAGKHPSALRKERFPELVAEIQAYNAAKAPKKKSNLTIDSVTRLKSENERLKNEREALKHTYELETSRVLSVLIELKNVRNRVTELEKERPSSITPFART